MFKRLLITSCCLFMIATAHAQSQLEEVMNAIKNDHISDITKYFGNTIPITIDNIPFIYSRAQAEIVLKVFFSENNPKDLVVESSGSADNSSRYAISDFSTSNRKYSLYILMKLKERNSYQVQEIKLSKE